MFTFRRRQFFESRSVHENFVRLIPALKEMGQGSFVRQIKVFMTALAVFLDYKVTQKKEKWTKASAVNRLWEKTHKRNAKRVLKIIVKLEGLWVKLGQYMSTRADVLPEAYIDCLRQLQDSLPPRRLSEVYKTIEKELGKSPDEIFKSFDKVPLATASIAQVHKAETKDGVKVVVKVQHEGIKDIILQDLKNARTIVKWVAWAEPQFNFGPVMDEWCNEVPKELDFNAEAENTRIVAQNLANKEDTRLSADRVDVIIPDIIQSAERVLVLKYMDGIRLTDVKGIESSGVNKQNLVETITRSYAHQIFIDGFFNADPHPGNFLISREAPHLPVLLDFGLTKSLTFSKKQAIAKLLLASAEGDYASLLSSFSELGLKLRLDIPEEAMEVMKFFFRRSIPAKQSIAEMPKRGKESEDRMKRLEAKMKEEDNSDGQIRNPVDAFPGELVFFMRVLNLLRGMSSMLDTQVVYLEVMRPFAEVALRSGDALTKQIVQPNNGIHGKAVHSSAEEKLRGLLQQMIESKRILGVQVCAYQNGKVVIDTAGGVLGKFDPRPVESDSLFPTFSVTKGVTAGLLHRLADQGRIDLHEKVATYWPEFGVNGKENITVAHVLNHTAGLQNALTAAMSEDPMIMCNWSDTLTRIAESLPESPPGKEQQYHTFTYGWLCGGIAEKATGQSFQKLLEEAFVDTLGVNGEFYIGISPGVESRLASLTLDMEDLKAAFAKAALQSIREGVAVGEGGALGQQMSKTFGNKRGEDLLGSVSSMLFLFNTLFIRRAIIPSANGHFSARALARYYAMLATGGVVPPSSTSSEPPLGSHAHYPNKAAPKVKKNSKSSGKDAEPSTKVASYNSPDRQSVRLFENPEILDSFVGRDQSKDLAIQEGRFGLGFMRMGPSLDAGVPIADRCGFGHSGVGGSVGFCVPSHDFSLAITLNKMTVGDVTAEIVQLVTSELALPCPAQFAPKGVVGVEMRVDASLFSSTGQGSRPVTV